MIRILHNFFGKKMCFHLCLPITHITNLDRVVEPLIPADLYYKPALFLHYAQYAHTNRYNYP